MARSKKYSGEKKIVAKAAEIEALKADLQDYYKDSIEDDKKREEKIRVVIDKACWGWAFCPDTLEARINLIKGKNSIAYKKQRNRKEIENARELLEKKRLAQDKTREENLDMSFCDHLDLERDEKKFLKARKLKYYQDFDFNESSDEMILDKILLDELMLRRLEKKRYEEPDKIDEDLEKAIDTAQKRISKNIGDLGISRKSRIEFDQDIEGNIAQLADNLEKKLDEIRELEDEEYRDMIMQDLVDQTDGITMAELKQFIEDLHFQKLHEAWPEKNPIPEQILLEAEEQKALNEVI